MAHLHGIWPVATLLASQVCRALRVPYVLAPHGSLHRGALLEKWPRKVLGMLALGYGPMVRKAAALHVLNADEGAGAVVKPRRIAVIPNGIFADQFATPPAPGAFRETLPALGEAPYILFLSRLHPGKGLALLAEAFAAVAAARPDVHLVAAGGDQGGRALLEAGAARHGYGDRLHLVGELSGPRKDAAFTDAAVFVLPSHHEGFSMAITEALAWGRPVVISAPCHFPDVAEVDAGRIVPLDAAALAAGLLDVVADPAAADAMGARGRAMVLARYRWEAIAERTIALYRAILAADPHDEKTDDRCAEVS
ncbi:MAG: glycosyltransferase [bacterium]